MGVRIRGVILFHVYECSACTHTYMCAYVYLCTHEEIGTGSLGTGGINSCELPHGCRSSGRASIISRAEPPPQSLYLVFCLSSGVSGMAGQFLLSLSHQIIPNSFMQFLHFREKEAKGAT